MYQSANNMTMHVKLYNYMMFQITNSVKGLSCEQ